MRAKLLFLSVVLAAGTYPAASHASDWDSDQIRHDSQDIQDDTDRIKHSKDEDEIKRRSNDIRDQAEDIERRERDRQQEHAIEHDDDD